MGREGEKPTKEAHMEICILKFNDVASAEDAH
jgi:hypothetical protein